MSIFQKLSPFLFALAWLAACDTPSAPRSGEPTVDGPSFAVVFHEQIPLEIDDTDCRGEPFSVRGEFHLVITETTSQSGNSNFHFHNTAHGQGTGASGARYVFNQADEFKAQQQGDRPIVFQNTISILLIRQGSSDVPDNFVMKVNLRISFDPATGESEIVRENVTTECRG